MIDWPSFLFGYMAGVSTLAVGIAAVTGLALMFISYITKP